MIITRPWPAIAVLLATQILPLQSTHAAQPDYKLGDVATEDIVAPMRLQVLNPVATEELKRKVALQVPFVVRQTPQTAGEAEQELRQAVAAARGKFLAALKAAFPDGLRSMNDLGSPAVTALIQLKLPAICALS